MDEGLMYYTLHPLNGYYPTFEILVIEEDSRFVVSFKCGVKLYFDKDTMRTTQLPVEIHQKMLKDKQVRIILGVDWSQYQLQCSPYLDPEIYTEYDALAELDYNPALDVYPYYLMHELVLGNNNPQFHAQMGNLYHNEQGERCFINCQGKVYDSEYLCSKEDRKVELLMTMKFLLRMPTIINFLGDVDENTN